MNQSLEYALKLLSKKDYTEAEIRQKFTKRQVEKEEAEQAILFLKDKSFLNDKRFAENYQKFHPNRGKIRIKFELLKKGIDPKLIDEISEHQSNQDQIPRAKEEAEKWLFKKANKFNDKYKLKQNLISKLSRQGFEYGVILEAIEELLED